jgi:ABC-type uncharacterized transport system permease subunit
LASNAVSSYFLALPIGLYLTGWLVEFVRYWRVSRAVPFWSGGLLAMGWGAHTFLLAYGIWGEGVGLVTMVSGVAWAAMIANYVVHLRWRNSVFGFVFPPFAVALLLSTALLSQDGLVQPGRLLLNPAAWQIGVITHIVSILAGNLLFAMACLFSIVYLYQEHRIKAKLIRLVVTRLPSLNTLDQLNHRAIALGFFFLSVGILLGIGVGGGEKVPERGLGLRQIVPILTWIVYAAFLLQRAFQGQRGRITAIWSIAGFVVVMTSLVLEIYILATRA